MKLIVQNVTVVNADGRQVRDVFIEDGKIVGPFEDSSARRIDGSGKFLIPGAIDAHVHFREPGAEHKETWETGSRAAALGGVTTVLDMPNNNPAIVTVEALEMKRGIVKGRSHVNYAFHFGGSANLEELRKVERVAGVKVYMGSSTGNLLVDQPSLWEQIFQICKEKNLPVIVHAEDEQRIRERSRQFAGRPIIETHCEIRDCECAHIAADAAMKMREKIGNKLHLAHMSTAKEVELMRQFAHPDLTCEVAPHHLYFSKHDMKDGFLKMNPPLREEEDLRVLWEGVRDGTVSCIATDHAPHTIEEKNKMQPPSGVPGVEFLLPLMLNEVNEKMLSMEQLVQLLAAGPARIFALKGKGRIEEGMNADLVLVDMDEERTVTQEMAQSKCGWTPYEGYKLKGWPMMTIVNGEVVMEKGEIVGGFVGEECF